MLLADPTKTAGPRPGLSRKINTGFVMIVAWIGMCGSGIFNAGAAPSPRLDAKPSSAVTLYSDVTLTGSRIYVKDVIESESNVRFPPEARDLALLDAPAPGNDKWLPGKWVASIIRAKGRLPKAVVIATPEQIHVRRAYQTIAPEQLEKFFSDYVARRIEDPEFTITRIKTSGTDKFPVGDVTLQVLEPEPRQITGRISLRVRVEVGGEKFGWLTLSGWVERYDTVVCTSRYLSRGTVLAPDDVQYKRMNISRLPGAVVRDLDGAIGKRLRRDMKAGNYLRQNMLAVPPLIQKGDKVKLVARGGNIRIVTYGTAKESGGAGEQIRIENMTSEKTILGRVRDASTVDVIF